MIELILLNVYEESMRTAVLATLTDMETVNDFYKKKLERLQSEANASGDSSFGQNASRQDDPVATVQPLPT